LRNFSQVIIVLDDAELNEVAFEDQSVWISAQIIQPFRTWPARRGVFVAGGPAIVCVWHRNHRSKKLGDGVRV
jgi:hypothetical protein